MLKAVAVGTTALLLPLAMAGPAAAAESATVQLAPLNDSGSAGTAELMLDGEMLTVNIDSTNLVPGLPHAQHLHIGGNNVCPDMSAAGEDGVLSVVDGLPAYGEIQLALTTEGDFGPDSGLAVERFPVATAEGAVSYQRTFDLSEIEGDINLDDVVIVQHGIDTISPNGQYGPPPPVSELNPELPLEATAPANCGAVMTVAGTQMEQMPTGGVQTGGGGTAGFENEGLLALGAMGLLAAGAITVRRRAVPGSR